ncbi:MAG: protein kinase [Chiayiivirga sp.]|jgi:serine/threonine protein kinase|uniref:serine/threonine-protein kinase n=1 Tax=Chiayiivirga sp. TaxID=2041042 RepID=UPI0025BA7B3A|nr:serine/threonine-protein kinase [Chiayiivirga sp.]MCI1730665.1 protein kinase [Chiayiivirga sp.]
MTSNFRQLRAWVDACADLSPSERAAWIERTGLNPVERDCLNAALDEGTEGGYFARDPMQRLDEIEGGESSTPTDLLGKRFGAFVIERLIGRGGQGLVFLGVRSEVGFEQKAAIKLLRRSWLDAADLRRMRRERDVLARFEHAGAARLIDAGQGEGGLPYLAMEYVEGEALDQACARRGTGIDTWIGLFSELCQIVASAHRSLIVHRDLKPGNILVTREGAVKVLDFGIARLMDEVDGTHSATPLMTPGYAAPEQRRGEPATPATDVYALGVILKQLVSGRAPTTDRDGGTDSLPEHVPIELQWIATKATQPSSTERYRDAAELRDDIERFRLGLPVLAHPPSRRYRVRKFVSRHRIGVALGALLSLMTAASFATALWQARVAWSEAEVARVQRERADAVKSFVVGLLQSTAPGAPDEPVPDVRELVAQAAERIPQQFSDQAEVQVELLTTLGSVLIDMFDETRAIDLLERAERIALQHTPDAASSQMARYQLASAYLRSGATDDAKLRIELLQAVDETRLATEISRANLTKMAMIVAYRQGHIALAQRLGAQALSDAMSECGRGLHCDNLGSIQNDVGAILLGLGKFALSRDALQAAVEHGRASRAPGAELGTNFTFLASAQLALGDLQAAEKSIREAIVSFSTAGPALAEAPSIPLQLPDILLAQERGETALAVSESYLATTATEGEICAIARYTHRVAASHVLLGNAAAAVGLIEPVLAKSEACEASERLALRARLTLAYARTGRAVQARELWQSIRDSDLHALASSQLRRLSLQRALLLAAAELRETEWLRAQIPDYLAATRATGMDELALDNLLVLALARCDTDPSMARLRPEANRLVQALQALEPYPVAARLRAEFARGCP